MKNILLATIGILIIVGVNGGIVFFSWNIVAPVLNLSNVSYFQACAIWVLFSTILKPTKGVRK